MYDPSNTVSLTCNITMLRSGDIGGHDLHYIYETKKYIGYIDLY